MSALAHIAPAAPSLADLAGNLIAAEQRLRGLVDVDDVFHGSADDAFLDARDAFRGALEAETGISHEMFERIWGML
jgi:hypothetical protein